MVSQLLPANHESGSTNPKAASERHARERIGWVRATANQRTEANRKKVAIGAVYSHLSKIIVGLPFTIAWPECISGEGGVGKGHLLAEADVGGYGHHGEIGQVTEHALHDNAARASLVDTRHQVEATDHKAHAG